MFGIKLVIFNQIPFLAKNSLIITLVAGVLVIIIAMYYPGGLAQLLTELKTKIKVRIKRTKEGIYGKDLG
jgi:galactitol-specific phosphotransferase system IIC component